MVPMLPNTINQALIKLQAANGNFLTVAFLSPVPVIVQFDVCFLKTGLQCSWFWRGPEGCGTQGA
jgi:hypothetical protein